MEKAVIIVAGGQGLRMGSDIPKQFLNIEGKPILMRTIETFHNYDNGMQIVVVLPTAQQDYWKELCKQQAFDVPITIADGGKTRFHSVKNGLEKVKPEVSLIAVHDGVRPFVSKDVINRCFISANSFGAVIPFTNVVDTLRIVASEEEADKDTISKSATVPRSQYKLVQTPQVFQASLLHKAYEQEFNKDFTDDASVVEALGKEVTLIEGNRHNIKITTQFDLIIAEAIIKNKITL